MDATNREYLSELITRFTDGEITPEEELILKSEMQVDSSLLDEVKHHLLIKDAVKRDVEAFTPPAEAINGVFSQLGYNSPYASKSLFKRNWKPFLRKTSILALLLLIPFVAYQLYDNYSTTTSNSHTIQNVANINKSRLTNTHSVPEVSSNEINNSGKVGIFSNKSSQDKNRISINNGNSSNSSNSNNVIIDDNNGNNISINDNSIAVNTNSNNSIANIDYSESIHNRPNSLPISSTPSTNNNSIVFDSKYKFSLFNDSEYKLYMKDNLHNSNFDNLSLGVLFLSKGNFKGGFEVGQQYYSVLVSDANDINIVSDNRNILWYAATIRYDAKEISLSNITPYAQFAIGSGNFGKYMARYSLGLEYMPFEHGIGFNLGYEGSNLWYSTQSNPYSTSISGLIFGLSWKF